MPDGIHIPIALSRETNKLVNAKDVLHGEDCYCTECNGDLYAVNKEKIQRAHFRHKPDSNCKFKNNYESYIHWLTKEVFKEIDTIELPVISTSDLGSLKPIFHKKLEAYFHANNLSNEISEVDLHYMIIKSKVELQAKTKIKIDSCKIEVPYKTKDGDIKVDVVLYIGNQELFIEPYFTSKIDEDKHRKIADINISTISINLLDYVRKHAYLFTINDFKHFLMNNISSKKWEFIRVEKSKRLIYIYNFDDIFNKEEIKKDIEEKKRTSELIKDKERQQYLLNKEIEQLKEDKKKVNINRFFNIDDEEFY